MRGFNMAASARIESRDLPGIIDEVEKTMKPMDI